MLRIEAHLVAAAIEQLEQGGADVHHLLCRVEPPLEQMIDGAEELECLIRVSVRLGSGLGLGIE